MWISRQKGACAVALALATALLSGAAAGEGDKTASTKAGDLKPLNIELPRPAFKGTPKHAPLGANLEKPRKGRRPPFLAPAGSRNVAAGRPVTSTDSEPIIGEIKFATDGDKAARDGSYVELGPGLQHLQIDLGASCKVHAVLLWHYHASARIYRDVVIQLSDDPAFKSGVKTLFNNDHDNSSKLGLGEDKEFWETFEGKLVDAQGASGRYLRLYSNGSTEDDMNHYTEVEVFGLPIK